MKSPAPRVLLVLILGASSSLAQLSPGVSAKPSGRTLDEPDAAPAEQSVDLSRAQPQPATLALTAEEEAIFNSAMQGEAWAQTKLGINYVTSPSDDDQMQRGVEFLRKAAEQNDGEALLFLSNLATSGRGVPLSEIDAFNYCLRAATSGMPEAQHRLAMMHVNGRGTMRDPEVAVGWYKKAATQGYAPAKHALALLLLTTSRDGVGNSEAINWLQSAANDGHREAVFFLAGAIAHGDYGLAKDEMKAAEMALPRAEAGDAEFQFALATLFLKGEIFSDRRADGRNWLEKAAASGHAAAQQMLQEQTSPAR
jgi:TPR repeat protein